MHVVGHQVALLDAAFLLLRKRLEDRTEVAAQLPVQDLAPALRDEHDVVLALPLRVVEALVLFHEELPFAKPWAAHGRESPLREDPGDVKRRMPPRQSRGVSLGRLE